MKYILLICLIIIGLFILLSMNSSVKNEAVVNQNTGREDAYKSNFISACVKESGLVDACNCLYKYVVDNYTWDERMMLDRQVESGQSPQAIADAVSYCTSSYTQ